MDDKVACAVCGSAFKRITHKHTKRHQMSLEQYVEAYPDSELISKSTREGLRTNTLQHFIEKFGERGEEEYDKHRRFLAHKNSFEYMQHSKGWNKEQYDAYNKQRSSTLETFIARYGETEGTRRWDAYRAHQSIAGVTLEWFIERLGVEEGTQRYEAILRSKTHSLDTFVAKYGNEDGPRKYYDYVHKRMSACTKFISSQEREFSAAVAAVLNDPNLYSCDTKQFQSWDAKSGRLFVYDIVSKAHNLCIEYNGDFWHCLPSKYEGSYQHPLRKISAKEIWELDKIKANHIADRGFHVITIWESEWKQNPSAALQTISDYVKSTV